MPFVIQIQTSEIKPQNIHRQARDRRPHPPRFDWLSAFKTLGHHPVNWHPSRQGGTGFQPLSCQSLSDLVSAAGIVCPARTAGIFHGEATAKGLAAPGRRFKAAKTMQATTSCQDASAATIPIRGKKAAPALSISEIARSGQH